MYIWIMDDLPRPEVRHRPAVHRRGHFIHVITHRIYRAIHVVESACHLVHIAIDHIAIHTSNAEVDRIHRPCH